MTMKPLIPTPLLTQWAGVRPVLEMLFQRGFRACHMQRGHILSYCRKLGLEEGVEKYWSEMTLELLSSGQLRGGRGTNIDKDGFYRSAYLDSLSSSLSQSTDIAYSLHPGLNAFFKDQSPAQVKTNRALDREIAARKMSEFSEHALSLEGWDDTKKAAKKAYLDKCKDLGLQRKKDLKIFDNSECYGIESDNGLIYWSYFDAGGLKRLTGTVPLYFGISHGTDLSNTLHLGNLSQLVNGIFQYALTAVVETEYEPGIPVAILQPPELGVLGLNVLMDTFSEFILSIESLFEHI